MKSNPDKNKELVRAFLSELDKNATAIDGFFTPDCLAHIPGSPSPTDRNGFKRFVGMFYAAFPDLTHEMEFQIAEGDLVVSLVSACGTHKGDFQEIHATGKKIAITDIIIARIEQDRIIELWAQFDVLGLFEQLKE
ncbi:MAG: ester cyclase [Syntrophorhabdaceae bacterium]